MTGLLLILVLVLLLLTLRRRRREQLDPSDDPRSLFDATPIATVVLVA